MINGSEFKEIDQTENGLMMQGWGKLDVQRTSGGTGSKRMEKESETCYQHQRVVSHEQNERKNFTQQSA